MLQIDLDVWVTLIAQMVVIGGGLAAAYIGLKKWITKQAQPAREVATQVTPNGGSQESLRHIIENIDKDMGDLRDVGVTNRELATRADAKADVALDRIDRHIFDHGREGNHENSRQNRDEG